MSKIDRSSTHSAAAASTDCVALAREALRNAKAFRESVAAFDQINVAGIFGELQQMRMALHG